MRDTGRRAREYGGVSLPGRVRQGHGARVSWDACYGQTGFSSLGIGVTKFMAVNWLHMDGWAGVALTCNKW